MSNEFLVTGRRLSKKDAKKRRNGFCMKGESCLQWE